MFWQCPLAKALISEPIYLKKTILQYRWHVYDIINASQKKVKRGFCLCYLPFSRRTSSGYIFLNRWHGRFWTLSSRLNCRNCIFCRTRLFANPIFHWEWFTKLSSEKCALHIKGGVVEPFGGFQTLFSCTNFIHTFLRLRSFFVFGGKACKLTPSWEPVLPQFATIHLLTMVTFCYSWIMKLSQINSKYKVSQDCVIIKVQVWLFTW